MCFMKNCSIRTKFMGILLLTCTLALAVACTSLIVVDLINLREEMKRRLTAITSVVGSNCAIALTTNNTLEAEKILKSLNYDDEVLTARIIKPNGTLFAEYIRSNSTAETSILPDWGKSRLDRWSEMTFSYNISFHEKNVGTIIIQAKLQALTSRMGYYVTTGGVVWILSLLIALIISSNLHKILINPILELVEMMKLVSRNQDFSQRAAKHNNDELGVLVDGFNDMLSQIEVREQELATHHDELEQVVNERTSELEETKNKAILASKAKSEFLANMSHEIRTPMNGVLGMNALLIESGLNPAQQKYAQRIQSSAESLLDIIEEILDFSKIEAGRMEIECVNVDFHDLVEDALDVVSHRAMEKGIEIGAVVSHKVPSVLSGDPVRLRQVIVNLLSNAIKFTDKGEVSLNLSCNVISDQLVRIVIEVRDTGIGIPEDKLAQIFRAFTQTDASTTRQYGGTGLGLTICQRLVTLMDGTIRVESEEGIGSVFTVEVPMTVVKTKALPPEKVNTGLMDKHFLVVDESPVGRDMLEEQLSAWNFRFSIVKNGLSALPMLRNNILIDDPFDVVLIASGMEVVDSTKLADMIRSDPVLRDIVLICMRSSTDMQLESDVQDDLFNSEITKPIKSSELLDTLVNVFDKIASRKEGSRIIRTEHAKKMNAFNAENAMHGHVLLVEDNHINRELAHELLEKIGLTVDEAKNGKEAVAAWKDNAYDFILMDCQMPVLDGYEASRTIRALEQSGQHVPIIALTANAMKGDMDKCLAAGMDDYLSKPIVPEKLKEKARHWLDTKRVYIKKRLAVAPPAPVRDVSAMDLHALTTINTVALLERCLGDEARAEKFLSKFVENLQEDIEELEQAHELSDMSHLALLGHKLKGVAATMSAEAIREYAEKLEHAAKHNEPDTIGEYLLEIRREAYRFLTEYAQHCNTEVLAQ